MLSIRKIGVMGRTYRHLGRYRQILGVLFKYGFGDVIETLRIDQYLEIGRQLVSRKRRERIEKLTRAERARMALEELGPTFIKLGQILSTRSDLVPPEYLTEFAKLQDEVPPSPFPQIRQVIEAELEQKVEDLFDFIEEMPIASASIGQVHKVVLKDGEDAVIKVQRPGIQKLIEIDLEIMMHLATLMERHIEEFTFHQPVKIVEEFARTLEKEIDYTIEAANLQQFAGFFMSDPDVYIPVVFQETSTKRVLTMEFIEGIKISQVEALKEAGYDLKMLCLRGANFLLRQVFDYGFFHADPHPGNIFAMPNNIICLIDFGMVGSVSSRVREDFVDLIDGLVHQNRGGTTQALLKLTLWDELPQIPALETDVADFMRTHLYKPIKDVQIGVLLQDLFELVTRHRLRIPPDLFLMIKAFSTVEGIALLLDPEFDIIENSRPFLERVKLAKFSPRRLAGDAAKVTWESMQFLKQFPRDLLEINRLIREQKLVLRIEHQNLSHFLLSFNQVANRLSFSIVIAALLIASSLLVIAEVPPFFYGMSLMGVAGFLLAFLMGVGLLLAVLRKGRL